MNELDLLKEEEGGQSGIGQETRLESRPGPDCVRCFRGVKDWIL